MASAATGRTAVGVFAVDDRSVQLTWSGAGAGELVVEGGPEPVHREVTGGPGALTIDGLEPERDYRFIVRGPAVGRPRTCLARTQPALPGPELVRLSTLSDLHIGSERWDLLGRMREPDAAPGAPTDIHTVRCARAALTELAAWGAQHLLLKGDLTNEAQPEEWTTLGDLLAPLSIPVHAIPGNHDVNHFPGAIEPEAGAASIGLDLGREPRAIDLPGLRVVLFDSARPGHHRGQVTAEQRECLVALVGEHDGPCLVATHHYPEPTPVPTFWPPGIPRSQARELLDALARANPRTVVTSGHTHRHRRRQHGPIVITEVGSPRDYPGTWAGYVVHESGIRQVVRRVEAPDAIGWNERTRRGALGAWGYWSPGRLADRCFVHRWPPEGAVGGPADRI